jgi:asparagine synthase (glutamine-hydrolysing)
MCGIAGHAQPGGADDQIIRRQLEQLMHRGPDAVGVFSGEQVAIGQTRLAIIDLDTGDPPIADEKDRVGVALNGEIYNFRELREQLLAEGHSFRSQGDTEDIAHLAETREPEEVARLLDGMFAFAVHDRRSGRLALGRDRLGKKPLYYWHGNGTFVFASEIKGVLEHPAVPRRLDPEAIPGYLTFGYVPTPRTFYEGIRSVPPGHVLVLDPGGEPELRRYWTPGADAPARTAKFDDAATEVGRLLRAAVEKRLISDVPLGAFLSGGLDSSVIVALMSELTDSPVKTFCIGFDDDAGFDERKYAALVARRFGTDHTEFVAQPKALDLVERLVWHYDQPFGDSSSVPTFILSELTRQHVTVALSGDGGDEVFAGYERFAAASALTRVRRVPRPARELVRTAVGRLPPSAFGGRAESAQRFLAQAERSDLDAYRGWISFVKDPWRDHLLRGHQGWALDDYARAYGRTNGDPVERLLTLNLQTYLLDDLLPKTDRMSMAHGLEVRAPFLDRDLVEYAISLPRRYKLHGASLKRILRHHARDLLPAEILGRRKRGFGVPLDRWFRTDLRSLVESRLGAPDARVRSHLDGDALDGLLAEHASGRVNHGQAIWTLLTLELFLRREDW